MNGPTKLQLQICLNLPEIAFAVLYMGVGGATEKNGKKCHPDVIFISPALSCIFLILSETVFSNFFKVVEITCLDFYNSFELPEQNKGVKERSH